MTDDTVLLTDPVFQLNTFLWALEDLPEARGEIHPVLRTAGYYLVSIGQRVIIPVDEDVLEALKETTGSRDRQPARPDLWLKHTQDDIQPIVELKAHGFSSESSSKVLQAAKLLVSAVDLGPSRGGGGHQPGQVVYATSGEDAVALLDTLRSVADELESAGAPSAPTATIGIGRSGNAVTLSSPEATALPSPMAEALTEPAIVLETANPEDSVQPLYLVPWVPGIDDTQDPELRSDGLYQLTARLLTHAIARVGQATVPTTVTLDGAELLSDATYGVFRRWKDADRRDFWLAAVRLLDRALRPTERARRDNQRVEVDLPTTDVQASVIERLEQADPADPAKSIEAALLEEPTLFEADE